MVMLRLQHSWTRWRRSRTEKAFLRARNRLSLLTDLGAEQLLLVQRLERELHPPKLLVLPEPDHPPTPEELRPGMLYLPQEMEPEPETPDLGEPLMLVEVHPEPEEQQEPPAVQIARLLGLPPRPSSSPSSENSAP
jgi:hypothetical protein